jgi:guanine deaminase
VGKLSMDIDITSPNSLTKTYTEKSASESLAASRGFVQHCREIGANLPEFHRLVEPVLTPRFVPTCTDELLAGLGEISETGKIKIQSHLAEAKDQVEWVRAERGVEDIDVFEKVIYRSSHLRIPVVNGHLVVISRLISLPRELCKHIVHS